MVIHDKSCYNMNYIKTIYHIKDLIIMLFMDISNNDNDDIINFLYKQYKNLMFKTSLEILGDEYLAEDAVQLSFERIIHNIHKINNNDNSKTRSFLVTICKNISRDIIRNRSQLINSANFFDDIEGEISYNIFDPLQIVLDQMMMDQIVECIYKLKENYRDVMLLKFYHDYDYIIIAKLLNIPPATVRKRYERGKGELLSILKRDGFNGKK